MIIPAIDLIGGKVVRLYQGDYGQKTEYSADPQPPRRYQGCGHPCRRRKVSLCHRRRKTPIPIHIDWQRRYRLMRMHTACHLLSVVCQYPITGAAVGEEEKPRRFRYGRDHRPRCRHRPADEACRGKPPGLSAVDHRRRTGCANPGSSNRRMSTRRWGSAA